MLPVAGGSNIPNPVESSCLPCQRHLQGEGVLLAWLNQDKQGFQQEVARNRSNKPFRWTRERRYLIDCLVGLGPERSSRMEVDEAPAEHNLDQRQEHQQGHDN